MRRRLFGQAHQTLNGSWGRNHQNCKKWQSFSPEWWKALIDQWLANMAHHRWAWIYRHSESSHWWIHSKAHLAPAFAPGCTLYCSNWASLASSDMSLASAKLRSNLSTSWQCLVHLPSLAKFSFNFCSIKTRRCLASGSMFTLRRLVWGARHREALLVMGSVDKLTFGTCV